MALIWLVIVSAQKEYKLLTQKTYDYYNNNFSLEIQKNNSNKIISNIINYRNNNWKNIF